MDASARTLPKALPSECHWTVSAFIALNFISSSLHLPHFSFPLQRFGERGGCFIEIKFPSESFRPNRYIFLLFQRQHAFAYKILDLDRNQEFFENYVEYLSLSVVSPCRDLALRTHFGNWAHIQTQDECLPLYRPMIFMMMILYLDEGDSFVVIDIRN
jgi:hypothetical protein